MKINEIQEDIIKEFSKFDNCIEKYEYIIELGRKMPIVCERNQDNLIDGCQSKVWINIELHNCNMYITADSDTIITRGIVALLIRIYNEKTPKEIINSELYFMEKIGLNQYFSQTRSNGLFAMARKIKRQAILFNDMED